jgi:hypothetical protein
MIVVTNLKYPLTSELKRHTQGTTYRKGSTSVIDDKSSRMAGSAQSVFGSPVVLSGDGSDRSSDESLNGSLVSDRELFKEY